MGRGLFLTISAAALASGAHAAPWTQGEGDIYARAAVAVEDLNGASGLRGDVYGEYGVRDRWSLTAKAEAVTYDDAPDFDRETYRITARHKLIDRNGWVAAIEAGPVYGSAVAGVFGCDALGGEARASAGYSGARKSRDFYVFGDLAVIGHEDGCRRQRAELGYGADVGGNVFVSQQVWIERGNQSANSNKYETLIGYHFDGFDLSGGYREEFGGDFSESSWVIAITVRR